MQSPSNPVQLFKRPYVTSTNQAPTQASGPRDQGCVSFLRQPEPSCTAGPHCKKAQGIPLSYMHSKSNFYHHAASIKHSKGPTHGERELLLQSVLLISQLELHRVRGRRVSSGWRETVQWEGGQVAGGKTLK